MYDPFDPDCEPMPPDDPASHRYMECVDCKKGSPQAQIGQIPFPVHVLAFELGLYDKAKIFASDLNTDALDAAKKGNYKYRFNIGYLDNFDKVIKENPYNYDEYNDVAYTKYFKIDKVTDSIQMNDFLRQSIFSENVSANKSMASINFVVYRFSDVM